MLRTSTARVTAPLVVGAAQASPYWIDYEASSGQFPEQPGWTRLTNYGGDQRSVDVGWLLEDGSAGGRVATPD
jgi:hypothetical protein